MDNPCKNCDKANLEAVNDGEYGCDTPCKKATDFTAAISKSLDEILDILSKFGDI